MHLILLDLERGMDSSIAVQSTTIITALSAGSQTRLYSKYLRTVEVRT